MTPLAELDGIVHDVGARCCASRRRVMTPVATRGERLGVKPGLDSVLRGRPSAIIGRFRPDG